MTLKNNWMVQSIIGLGGMAVLAMAAQFWISIEVKSQLADITIPDVTQMTTDIEVIKTTVLATDEKADTAIANQQRFEEIFTEYLINEANR